MLEYLLYLCVGGVAGLISGLFGIGGGVVIVPVLILTFTSMGFPDAFLTQMAIGTSLATIAITSLASVYTHNARGAVRWDLVGWLAPGLVVGAVIGGLIAVQLKGTALQMLFGAFLVLAALEILFGRGKLSDRKMPGNAAIAVTGAAIGSISSLFGIGGGTLTVPYLSYFGVKMHQAVASSAACGFPIALIGAATYIVTGWSNSNVPGNAMGYVFVPAWIGVVLASVPGARLGAIWAHHLNEHRLRASFAWLLILLGLRFIWVNATGL